MRHKKRRTRRRSGAGANAGAIFRIILLIAIAGAAVYLVCSSSVGTFISQNLIAPIFSAMSDPEQTYAPTPTFGAIDIGGSVEGVVTLPGLSCYALQMGAYASPDNADLTASAIKAEGGAGYIVFAEERYRVLAAGYGDQEDAASVRERLQSAGRDCTLFLIESFEEQFLVTSTQDNIAKIDTAFSALYSAISSMEEASIAFDKENMTPEEGSEAVRTIAQTVDAARLAFDISGENSMIADIAAAMDEFSASLHELADFGAQSALDFSSGMKYAQLAMISKYVDLANKLRGDA